ncbi:unnamed protein product [Hyaloperonospora brassicae]|uniref:TFIIS N-terminal domain-containing protein n=1 Tax=Hyaloperonospora brassicae TaxID=162125 RepID=A0AAV0U1P8_HYABA|nr:unnamed protein product [Hyaloperonospora brassicae]
MQSPQRFPLGARVANPVEGRTGRIEAFDAHTGLYALVYHDGHRDELPADQTEAFLIPSAAVSSSSEAIEDSATVNDATSSGAADSDPNQLLGLTVTRTSTSYDGKRLTSSGQVTQYFADLKRFRVLFSDGLFADLTRDEVQQYAEQAADSDAKSESESATMATTKNKQRTVPPPETACRATDRPLRTQKFDSRKAAYAVCREVLRIVLHQKTMAKCWSDKQKVVMHNKDLQAKRALEAFVEADGLNALEKMLGIWIRVEKTQSAALLILKVLAVLPGVKEEHLRKTNIARTLRGIEKLSHTSYLGVVFGDLAHWVIQKWPKSDGRGRMARCMWPRTQLQSRLRDKRRRRDWKLCERGANTSAEPQQDPSEEVVVYLPQFNSLGSEDMRRPVRQTQVIESLAAKLNRDYEDSVRKHQDDDAEGEDDGVAVGRVTFGKPRLMHFSQHTPVVDLFCTARSKLLEKNARKSIDATDAASGKANDAFPSTSLSMPNKTQAPKKTILKARDDVITPASQTIW